MAATTRLLNNAEVLVEGNKLSGFAQSVAFTLGRNSGNVSTIQTITEKTAPLLRTAEAIVNGLVVDEDFESDMFNVFDSTAGLLSFSFMNVGSSSGADVVFSRFGLSEFSRPNSFDDFQKFELSLETSDEIYRGKLLDNQNVSAAGALTGFNFGAIDEGEVLVARVHLVSASDPAATLDIKLESDADNAFGTPTDRITFPQFTGRGVNTIIIDGPITDTWFRFNVTAISTGGDFDIFTMLAKRFK